MADQKKKIALLSNITVDLIVAKLRKKYEVYVPEGYDTWMQEILNPASVIYSDNFDAFIVLLDGTEARSWKNRDEAAEKINLWEQTLSVMFEQVINTPIFVSTIDIRENRIKSYSERRYKIEFENAWYQFLQDKAEGKNNVYINDLADIIAEIGRNNFYSNKMWYMSSMPYSRDGLNAIVEELNRALNALFADRKKIISLDLDNTIWGGIIGEDGIEGIELSDHKEGQRFYDFQRQFLEMKKRGTILAINSKNNKDDAETVIQGHPFMLLKDNDFVIQKINWESKAANIKAMETELNITEGGFIFIDDNPVERETVKGECPEVFVPDFPTDTSELLSFAENIWENFCKPLRVLQEDLKKTEMYQSEVRRKEEMNASLNLDEYIAKLEIAIDIHRMRPEELERVVQLCHKTNQFNVTTKRYTQMQIKEIAANLDNAIYVVSASDKYGSNGLVSVIILRTSRFSVKIDTFLMSCRVMGRKLEDAIINELAACYRCKQKMIGEYIPTAKNIPVKNIYDRLGFRLISDNDGCKTYELKITDYEHKVFSIYKSIQFEG